MLDFAKKRLNAIVPQKDYSHWTLKQMDTPLIRAQALLDLNSTFRFGIATESELILPPSKRILIPVLIKGGDQDTLQQMYLSNVLMLDRFTLRQGDVPIKSTQSKTTGSYKKFHDVVAPFQHDKDAKIFHFDDNMHADLSNAVNPDAYGWLTLACLRLNYLQFKANYPTINEAVLATGAHAVAMAYRNGLIESYASREFYFVGVTQTDNGSCEITLLDKEYAALENAVIHVNDVLASETLAIDTKLMEVGLGIVMGAGASHYSLNHTTGGRELSGQNARALAINGLYNPRPGPTDPNLNEQTDFYYNVLHPVNKRAVACLIISNSRVYTWHKNDNMPNPSVLYADAFMNYRTKLTPAGCHKVYVAMLALKAITEANLYVFLPDMAIAEKVQKLYEDLQTAGARGHLGSAYYTDEPPSLTQAEVDDFLPLAAYFVIKKMPASSLAGSPHLSLQRAEESNDKWKSIVNATLRISAAGASVQIIEDYLRACGSFGFSIDLTSPQGIQNAIAVNNKTANNIRRLLGLGEIAVI